MNIDNNILEEIVKTSLSYADVLKKLNLHDNGTTRKKLKELILKNNLSTTHFNSKLSRSKKNTKWKSVKKECPICKNKFITKEGHPREKKTCSYSCANSYFRSGKDNPNWKNVSSDYRTICFQHYEHKCLTCDESVVLDVHHLDGDRTNNDINNLIPLCPTHHAYMHRGYSYLIENKILARRLYETI